MRAASPLFLCFFSIKSTLFAKLNKRRNSHISWNKLLYTYFTLNVFLIKLHIGDLFSGLTPCVYLTVNTSDAFNIFMPNSNTRRNNLLNLNVLVIKLPTGDLFFSELAPSVYSAVNTSDALNILRPNFKYYA